MGMVRLKGMVGEDGLAERNAEMSTIFRKLNEGSMGISSALVFITLETDPELQKVLGYQAS